MPGTLATDRVSKKWPVPLRTVSPFSVRRLTCHPKGDVSEWVSESMTEWGKGWPIKTEGDLSEWANKSVFEWGQGWLIEMLHSKSSRMGVSISQKYFIWHWQMYESFQMYLQLSIRVWWWVVECVCVCLTNTQLITEEKHLPSPVDGHRSRDLDSPLRNPFPQL